MRKSKKISTTILILASICASAMILNISSDIAYEDSESVELNNSNLSLSSIDSNGIPICTDGEPVINAWTKTRICSDLEGGAFIAWSDERLGIGNESIYVQRVNTSGIVQWEKDGITICNNTDPQITPLICSDGTGGAIIVWLNAKHETRLYAQRINSHGDILWNPDGVLISDTGYRKKDPKICIDGFGGAVIAWQGPYPDYGIYVQKINSSGNVKWSNNGVQICTGGNYPRTCTDGAGGAIIAWKDNRNAGITGSDIYAQSINATGDIQWTNNGVGACTWPTHQWKHQICSDGMGGAIIAYKDSLSDTLDHVRVQSINSSGSVMWRSDGVCMSNKTNFFPYIQICNDNNGGAYVSWQGSKAQRVNSTGHIQWKFGGRSFSEYGSIASRMCQDGFGGAIIAWKWDSGVYAQRLDAFGNSQWIVNGIAISTTKGTNPVLCSDGSGGAIIVWYDHRVDLDLYAQLVDSTGDVTWLITIKDVEGGVPGYHVFLLLGIVSLVVVFILRKNSKKIKRI